MLELKDKLVTLEDLGSAMNYDFLSNKPSIAGVQLLGDISLLDLGISPGEITLLSEVDVTLPSEAGCIYLDITDTKHVIMRLGDGDAYIRDLPTFDIGEFNDIKQALNDHLSKKDYHTKSFIDSKDPENLILTTL